MSIKKSLVVHIIVTNKDAVEIVHWLLQQLGVLFLNAYTRSIVYIYFTEFYFQGDLKKSA